MSTLLDAGRNGARVPLEGIIDMHGHLGRYSFAIPDIDESTLVATMDRIGVRSILCSTMQCMSSFIEEGNDTVLDAMRRFPDRILGYVCVWPGYAESVADQVSRRFEQGFTGIKLHSHSGIQYNHPDLEPAYRLAHELRRPMLFHTWGRADEFEYISRISRDYPDCSILLAHAGAANEKGYVEMATEHENVFLDLALSRSPEGVVDRLAAEAGAHKVVWGSDCYFMSMTQQVGKVLGARIPDEDKKRILGGNASAILARCRKADPASDE